MKLKLDQYDIKILVNGLYSMRDNYYGDQLAVIEELILKLIDTSEIMKPKGKKRI